MRRAAARADRGRRGGRPSRMNPPARRRSADRRRAPDRYACELDGRPRHVVELGTARAVARGDLGAESPSLMRGNDAVQCHPVRRPVCRSAQRPAVRRSWRPAAGFSCGADRSSVGWVGPRGVEGQRGSRSAARALWGGTAAPIPNRRPMGSAEVEHAEARRRAPPQTPEWRRSRDCESGGCARRADVVGEELHRLELPGAAVL